MNGNYEGKLLPCSIFVYIIVINNDNIINVAPAMKQQIFIKRAGIFGMVCLLILSFTSCLKNNDDYVPIPVSLISAINASPNAGPVDFYLDQNRGNYYPVESGESLDYIRAYTGKRNASFYISMTQQKIKTDTITLKADNMYSLFLSNVASSPDYLLITDSIAQPEAGKATIRFVNLSPDVTSADLAILGGEVIATDKSYRTYSSFIPVQGDTDYTFEIRQGGTANVLSTLSNIRIKIGSIYTIWIQGLAATNDETKLSSHIQNNVYYY